MKIRAFVLPAVALCGGLTVQAQTAAPKPPAPAPAPAAQAKPPAPGGVLPTKIGLLDLRGALTKTTDGQKAQIDLEDKFAARKSNLQRRQVDLQAKQDTLSRGAATMSEAAKANLSRELDNDQKVFKRDVEDMNTDAEEEQNKSFGAIFEKMKPVISQFAIQNGYAVIFDVSSDQSPVLWASNASSITDEIVALYNQAHPPVTTPAKPAPAAGAAKPLAPPPIKKQ